MNFPVRFFLLAFVFHFSVLSKVLIAGILVVSTNGDNNNPGTSARPFADIQIAFNKVKAGDTVFIRGGLYSLTSELRTIVSGHPDKWITYMAWPGEEVWIDADKYTSDSQGRLLRGSRMAVLQIEGVSYSRFINIGVKNSHTVGIIVNGPGTKSIEVDGCKSAGSYGSGISIWYSDSVRIYNCVITGANNQDMRPIGVPLRHEAPHEALSVCGATHFEIAWNELYNCEKEGIDCKEVSAHGYIHNNFIHDLKRQGLYVDCWFGLLEDVEFSYNTVKNCEIGMAISGEGKNSSMRNIRVHHNLIFKNRASGIVFGIWGSQQLRKDIYIYNNTIYGNGSPNHWHGPTGGIDVRSSNIENVYIYNNICSGNYCYEIATFDKERNKTYILSKKNIIIEHNWICQFKDIADSSGIYNKVYAYSGENFFEGRPAFRDTLADNFCLSQESQTKVNSWHNAPFFVNYLGAFEYNLNKMDSFQRVIH